MPTAFLHRLLHTGVTPALAASDAKHVVVVNAVVLAVLSFGVGWVAIGAVLRDPVPLLLGLVQVPTFLVALRLNARGWQRAAATHAQLAGNVLLVALTALLGLESQAHLILLLGTLFPFLVLPPREGRLALILSATSGASFVGCAIFLAGMPPRYVIDHAVLLQVNLVVIAGLFALVGYYVAASTASAEAALEAERARSERLLLNVLPAPIAQRLKDGEQAIADGAEVTVLFTDIVGFTALSGRLPPDRLVKLLDEVFSAFDDLCARHGLEKIKTIGDAYMVAAGIPEARADHAAAIARMALEMRDAVRLLPAAREHALDVRIGAHTGPIVAGVIGKAKFAYDVWGDTVNTAARMESHGAPGEVHVTDELAALLADRFVLEPRGEIDVKGKGRLRTWFLRGEKAA